MDGESNNRPGQGYHGYRSRDERQDRDRSNREQSERSYDDRRQSYGSSSQGSSSRNPFAGGGNGGYDNGDRERDRYGSSGGGRDYHSGGRGGDRYGNGNGGSRGYGGSNGRGNGGGSDRYGNNREERYGGASSYSGGNGGGRSSGGSSGGSSGRGSGQGYSGGGQRHGSYERRSGSGGSGETGGSGESPYDAVPRKRPMDDDNRSERSPMSQERPNKKHQTDGAGPSRPVRKEKSQADKDKERRNRYEIFKTKPDDAPQKQGCSGEPIRLKANYFELMKRPNYEMVMYRIDFEPEIELAATRKYLMYTQRDLFGAYLYDTKNSVYLTHRLPQDVLTVDTEDRQKIPYKMTIKFGTIVSMDTRESLQVLNLILRRAMEGLNLQLIGRNLFDPKGLVSYNNFHIQLWPGYTTSIRQHEESVLLCAEITSKVMRNETVYDILRQTGRDDDFRQRFQNEVLGMIVLTDYNNKTYKIDDVNFNASPSDTFDTKKGPITFIQYYKEKYNIIIRNSTQPMLITRSSDRQRRGGEDETISLIPELCRPTGLTEQQRNNFQLMKAIADQTRMDPRKRMMALSRFNQRLQSTPASQDILRAWNMDLDRQLIDIDGRKLKNENIIYGCEEKELSGPFSDWQNAFKNKSMFLSYPLRNWVFLVPFKLKGQAQSFFQMIRRASSQMRFEVSDPMIINVDDRLQSYGQAFEQANNSNPQLIMAFVNNNNADKYATIKKLGCCTYGTPTQVIVQKTLNNKNLMSIATKVAIQLNCKLGGTPWLVSIPTKGLMTVGVDVSKDSKEKKVSWLALVASMDLTNVTKESYFSCVSRHTEQSSFTSQLAVDMTRALKAFYEYNGAFPSKIVLYRDGVGDGQLEYVYHTELAEVKSRLEQTYAENNAVLKFVFIVVSKKVNTRIFGRDEKNPPSGTVVDTKITLPERQDFYLISQTVRQGTVSPTAYNVIYDSLRLPADRLQQLTYKQCHLYYNWAGTVRVPAVCQCAHKLSFLVSQFLHQEPLSKLERQLYFL